MMMEWNRNMLLGIIINSLLYVCCSYGDELAQQSSSNIPSVHHALKIIGPSQGNSFCPVVIETKQYALKVPQGWRAGEEPLIHNLSYVMLYLGSPADKMALEPDNISENAGTTISEWMLQKDSDYWIKCEYRGTKVTMIRELDRGITSCVVQVSKEQHAGLVSSLMCK